MNSASVVLLAVASELAGMARMSMPELQDGEQIQCEWYENGVFSRQTVLHGETFVSQFDFRQRKSRRVAVGKQVNV